MADENAWLIERGSGWVAEPEYLGVTGTYNEHDPGRAAGAFYWTRNHLDALRFARKIDAALTAGALRDFFNDVPFRLTLAGLRPGDDLPRIAEHAWVDGSGT